MAANSKYQEALDAQEASGNIYTSLFTGRWDQQQVDGFTGNYSVYVPSNFEYCSPGVMLLTPDGVTATEWLDSELGQKWVSVADTNGIALVVAEPQDGKWNLNDLQSARDDEAYLYGIYGKITDKTDENESTFDLNERALYLVGYDEGATAANEMAMKWPALFAGVTAVGGDAVPSDVASALGNEISYPFAEASTEGREENNLPNKEIPVRIWQIETDSSHKSDIVYWTAANDLSSSSEEKTNDIATVVSNLDEDGNAEPEQVWYSSADSIDSVDPSVIYGQFLADVQRFVGDPGGYLEWTIQHENDGTHGFFLNEEKVDGYTRRWYTYVPQSYDGSTEYPLVVAMHGYSSAISAFTGDSRWQNVADKYGIIIVFPQAYVNHAGYGSNGIPVPVWNNYSTVLNNTESYEDPDDVGFIKYLVDDAKADYNIDATRVYATGHSNGSAMTWMLAQDAAEYFTAVAPIGFNWGSYPGYALDGGTVDYSGCEDNSYVLPVWCMTGSYDVGEADDYSANTKNGKTVSYWKAQNGTYAVPDKTSEIRDTRAEHIYTTTTYSGENDAPLVRFTQISNNCHSYMEDIAFMVWEEFFTDYTREADGTLYYKGQKVEKQDGILSDAFTDISNHWGKAAIESAVDTYGLFAGTTTTTFSPSTTMTRGMLVAVLYRMDPNAQAVSMDSLFEDVADDAYYEKAVNWAKENNIVAGVSETQFAPSDPVTRQQIAAILYRYATYKGYDVSASTSLDKFTDGDQTSEYARTAMQWAAGSNLFIGKNDNVLDPKGNATRAEVATILVKFCQDIAK
ncbi:MAG: S-layer homology domain-containing protein [Eubacteriales bacterium]|nr:S-layer homology domain-containing protein [Eubacteriales bacterium]